MTEEDKTQEAVEAPETQPAPAKRQADPVRRWTFMILALCAVLFAAYLRSDRVTPYTTQARVNALVVPIASEVSGRVTSVSVSRNQLVKAGQELFQVNRENYELAIQTAEANYASAVQAVGAAQANVDAARASIKSAEASKERAQLDAIRMRNIREQDPGAISQRRLESAEASLAATEGSLAAAQAQLDKAVQDLGAEGDANARILEAQAGLDQAKLNLERATVRAPVDGIVTDVRLDQGNYAAAGAPQLTFVATDNIWLQADFTENNMGHIKPGDRAEIVFDALPGQVISGTVREIGFGVAVDTAPMGSLPTISNDPDWLREAQRYPVLVNFQLPSDRELKVIKVGSQASVVIYTGANPIMNPLSRLWMWMTSYLTYAY